MSSYFDAYAQKADRENYMKEIILNLLFDFLFPFVLKIIKKKILPVHIPEVELDNPLYLPDH